MKRLYISFQGSFYSLSVRVILNQEGTDFRCGSLIVLQGGVVVANTTGTNFNPDHHRFYPHAVLWSNITLGLGAVEMGHCCWDATC